MAMPYYVKKRITDISVSIIMLMFLALRCCRSAG